MVTITSKVHKHFPFVNTEHKKWISTHIITISLIHTTVVSSDVIKTYDDISNILVLSMDEDNSKHNVLYFGASIKRENDVVCEKLAVNIAEGRAMKKPFNMIVTNSDFNITDNIKIAILNDIEDEINKIETLSELLTFLNIK